LGLKMAIDKQTWTIIWVSSVVSATLTMYAPAKSGNIIEDMLSIGLLGFVVVLLGAVIIKLIK